MLYQNLIILACIAALVGSERSVVAETANGRERQSKAPGAAIEMTFEKLEFDPGEEFRRMFVPKDIDAANGKRVRVRGYMWPTFDRSGIQKLILLRNGSSMRFGAQQNEAYEAIRVTVSEGWGTEYTNRPIIVEGTFSIDPMWSSENKCLSLYRLDDATVFGPDGTKLTSLIDEQGDE